MNHHKCKQFNILPTVRYLQVTHSTQILGCFKILKYIIKIFDDLNVK